MEAIAVLPMATSTQIDRLGSAGNPAISSYSTIVLGEAGARHWPTGGSRELTNRSRVSWTTLQDLAPYSKRSDSLPYLEAVSSKTIMRMTIVL